MILFSGSSNLPLAQKIAEILGISLGQCNLNRFADGEIRPWIVENVRNQTIFVLQSFSSPMNDHIMEFILMGDAIRRGAPKKIVGIIPYFGYARQDKQHREGEPVSARIIAKLVEVVPYQEVVTFDLHNDAIVGFFRIPVIHRNALTPIARTITPHLNGEGVVVSPDVGGVKRARNMSYELNMPLVVMEKKRRLHEHDVSEPFQILGDVHDKTVILVDDIISTGGTIIKSAEVLKNAGARKILVATTHGVFSGNSLHNLQNSLIDRIIVSDTIQHDTLPEKFTSVSVANTIAESIRMIVLEE
jgi:ribose-phosphate pyrophosphokinase